MKTYMRYVDDRTEPDDPAALVEELKRAGFRIIADPPELFITPADKITPQLRRRIERHGKAIVDYIDRRNGEGAQ